ncbi:hypothetical protein GCM10022284_66770 [Streptomyces hundungensis]
MPFAPSPVGGFAVVAGAGVESAKALGAVTVSTAVAASTAAAIRRPPDVLRNVALRMTAASQMYGFPVHPGG